MLENISTIILIVLIVLCCVVLLLARRERRKIQKFEQEISSLSGVPFEKLETTTPLDDEAYRLIEEERRRIWKSFSADTEFTAEYVFSLSRDITRKIAAIYFPDKQEPLYQATVHGLLHLFKRVTERVEGYLNKFPLTMVRDRTIEDMIVLHSGYKKIKESPIGKILGNKFVTMARQIAWGAYNVSNPWYYGRQLVWAVGREAGIRYFLTLIITIVGEEAVLLYRSKK
jgi:hypothetical protein